MRELHGVMRVDISQRHYLEMFKRRSLLFDKLHVFEHIPYTRDHGVSEDSSLSDEWTFLKSKGLVKTVSARNSVDAAVRRIETAYYERFREAGTPPLNIRYRGFDIQIGDLVVRDLAAQMQTGSPVDITPICLLRLDMLTTHTEPLRPSPLQDVVRIALSELPAPGEESSWQDILDFKAENYGKRWGFRRFLTNLATKPQTEAEIKDEIDWTLNEYTKAMEIHNIKAAQSFVDVFVITPLEIIENLMKFNWSKIAKGALQVSKRKVELMEAEMKAPGRECAYVFDARQRFGDKG